MARFRHAEEFEHSKYYFEVADVERVRKMYDLFSAEADACLAQGLIVPAHDYVLKCSHSFNILDTRGAISVAERQAFFRRIRELARKVAEGYLEERKQLEYPLLKDQGIVPKEIVNRELGKPGELPIPHSPLPFLLEMGIEELPASDVDMALIQLRERIPSWLDELRLDHGSIRIHATPRRLAVSIENLSPNQPDRDDLVKGPPADKAFDKNGIASPAAMGFAKKNGVDTKDLQVKEENGGKYVYAVVKQKGRSAPEVLAEALPKLVESIKFEKSMRWNDSGVAFSRPIRWFVALLGDQVIPFEYAGVTSGNITRGLRPYDLPEIKIASADKYFDVIREASIVLDKEERKASIVEQVKQAAALMDGEAIIADDLLDEVTNLIEMPTAVMGGFNEEFLQLPKDVLISVMKKHQRYFPVQKNGKLLPHFIAIRNGDDIGIDIVRQGNEHVLGARFADANFFVREDMKHKLEEFRPKLSGLIFQTKLGSMLDKSDREVKLAPDLTDMLGFKVEPRHVALAVLLARADLATQMVTEMTSLQGIIGGEYARRSGEVPSSTATAISEQYQPVPTTEIGLIIALTGRLDTLVGLFAAGMVPSGAKDPFGLRRAAIGIVQPLIEKEISFDLREAVDKSAKLQPIEVTNSVKDQILAFLTGRLSVLLKEKGYRYDVVDAVLAEQSHNPARAADAVKQLQLWIERKDWHEILPAYARCVRITRDQPGGFVPPVRDAAGTKPAAQKQIFKVNPKNFAEKPEEALYKALEKTESASRREGSVDDFFNAFVPMIPPVNEFFDKVLVMADDKTLKENRLGLLHRIAELSKGIADLSKLEGF